MTKTKASASVKTKKENETVEVAELEMEVETPITTEEVSEEVQGSDSGKKPYKNVLLSRFTPEDCETRNPDIFERFYKTFQPMGIADNIGAIQGLMEDYMNWYVGEQDRFKREEEVRKAEAMEKIRKLAEKAGIEL